MYISNRIMFFKPAWALFVTLFTIASCTIIEHLGKCSVAPPDVNTICLVQCNGDASCSVNEKCCTFGCLTQCTPAGIQLLAAGATIFLFIAILTQAFVLRVLNLRMRRPDITATVTEIEIRRSSSCKDRCSSDIDCKEDEKCCSNAGGCGQSCQPTRVKHKGYCPPQGGIRGPCIEDTCNDDGNCKEDEKCCDTGCSKICKPSLPVRKYCTYSKFKQEFILFLQNFLPSINLEFQISQSIFCFAVVKPGACP
ncbi:hypothetical protein B566_EDAN015136 [Ephemera danica]|nr:hypothetical protein B566_EDAN015136 [Ephemera danica]